MCAATQSFGVVCLRRGRVAGLLEMWDGRREIGEVVRGVNMISKEILLSLCDYGKRFCRNRHTVS